MQGSFPSSGKYVSTFPLYEPMICPNRRLFLFTSYLRIALVWGCSPCCLNGLPAPVNATLPAESTAGVDQMPPPANASSGCFGGWMVHVFFNTRPVLASRKFIEP